MLSTCDAVHVYVGISRGSAAVRAGPVETVSAITSTSASAAGETAD